MKGERVRCIRATCDDPVCSRLYTHQREYEIIDHIHTHGIDCFFIINDMGVIDIVAPNQNTITCPRWELVKYEHSKT